MAEQNEYIKEAYECLEKMSADERKRREYEERQKILWDHNSFMKSAKIIGIREGREEGRKEGREEGLKDGRKEGQIELAILLIETKYHKSGEWLKQCTPQQMKHFHELFVQDMSYDDLKKNVLSY